MSADFVVGLLRAEGPVPAEDPHEAVRLVRFHRLDGLCVAWSRVTSTELLPPDLLEELVAAYRTQGLLSTLVLESARRARTVLEERGIASVLFKGAALVADGTYADPGARRMDDADLLVEPRRAVEAVDALMAEGFRPVTGWDPAALDWVDAVTLHDTQAPPATVAALDLHWRTAYDRLRFGGDGESILWEGHDATTGLPEVEPHLVLVAEHLLKHLRFKVHLAAYGDLARLAGKVRDWDRVAGLVAASRLERGLRALLSVLARDLGAPVPRPLADGVRGGLCEELAPEALVGRVSPVDSRLQGLTHRWRLLGSPVRVAQDLADAAFPPGSWLAARYGRRGLGAWLRYVGDVVRWSAYRGRSPASPNQDLFDPTARE